MDVREAYNSWAHQYDTNINKTRDLEATALRKTLAPFGFQSCLEIGCGTGKNTAWLLTKASHITAIDLSEEMLLKAKEKIAAKQVVFHQADITRDWTFATTQYELVVFSLVLEHIENLESIFEKTAHVLAPGGRVYVGELHPFKQYAGSKARFNTAGGEQVVNCYNHHISDFTQAAKKWGLRLADLNEYFDEDDRSTMPRILTLLLERS